MFFKEKTKDRLLKDYKFISILFCVSDVNRKVTGLWFFSLKKVLLCNISYIEHSKRKIWMFSFWMIFLSWRNYFQIWFNWTE